MPGDMSAAQRNLVLVAPPARDGIEQIAALLPTRPGQRRARRPRSTRSPARCRPSWPPTSSTRRRRAAIKEALDDNDISGQTIAQSRFLPDAARWLDPTKVAAKLGGAAGGAATPTGKPAPGRTATG